jgi:hypothetical protein
MAKERRKRAITTGNKTPYHRRADRRRGSVSRILFPRATCRGQRPFLLSRRCRRDRATLPEDSSGKDHPAPRRLAPPKGEPSYSVLLRMGFTRTAAHAAVERALTSPFHPCRLRLIRRRWSLFCGTFPRSLGAAVSGHPVLRSPDFPLSVFGERSFDPLYRTEAVTAREPGVHRGTPFCPLPNCVLHLL